MNVQADAIASQAAQAIHELVGTHARMLSTCLQAHRQQLFPPTARKRLRKFTFGKAARLIGTNDSVLRRLSLSGKGPSIDVASNGRRSYSAKDIQNVHSYLDAHSKKDKRYLPRSSGSEKLQVNTVANFKGGSSKTTTATHLSQHLALQGCKVLAIDLDSQASLSAVHRCQPEFDIDENEILYGAIRYDEQRRGLADIIRQTYFANLDLLPGNLELMEFERETPKTLRCRERTASAPAPACSPRQLRASPTS